ncbi:MAG: hypothetical protein JSV24_02745 [Bacteroidales bacterium]|nr:MAG: hypothetical protein JSV24_02745 [Bacteroidales bacterium]
MKTKVIGFSFLMIFCGFTSLFAQGFPPPAEGKSVVYFARVSIYGKPMAFEFFDHDKYFGELKGKQYFRYECDPGEHLFWASTENKEFMTAELREGETYIVIVDVITGFWKPHVGLSPINAEAEDLLERAKELINDNKPVIPAEKDIVKRNEKLADFITKELQNYNDNLKNEKEFNHLSADMAIPAEDLK